MVFALIMVGGLLHILGAAMSCPDWPLCYGELLSTRPGTILAQTHRYLAAALALFTLGIAIAVGRQRPLDRGLVELSRSAVVLVVLQAAVGGVAVILRLPTLISVAHLALGLGLFALCLSMTFRTRPDWIAAAPVTSSKATSLHSWVDLAISATFVEMLLGAFLHQTGAGAALGLGKSAALLGVDPTTSAHVFWPSDAPGRWNMIHRLSALVTATLIVTSAWKGLRFALREENRGGESASLAAGRDRAGLVLSLAAIALVATQLFLGIFGLIHNLAPLWVSLHLAVAVALFGVLLANRLHLGASVVPELDGLDAAFRSPRVESASSKGLFGQSLLDAFVLTKPRLAFLVIFTTAAGMKLAPGGLPFGEAALTIVFVTLVVAAGTTLNMYQEQEPDAKMERTKERPLPAGRLHPRVALIQGWVLALSGLVGLALVSNLLTTGLAALSLFVYLGLYTPMKSRSVSAVYMGAIPGALPIAMGWTAVTGRFDGGAIALFALLFVWQIPHFIAISLYRKEEYAAAGFKIFPLVYGERVSLRHIFATSVGLALSSLVLSRIFARGLGLSMDGKGGIIYFAVALALGSLIVGSSVRGFSRLRNENWARRFFFITLIYLPLALGVLLLDS
jgi:protoheme IX farnesyltransferase